MSNKTNAKKRVTLRIGENEVAVVGPIERWQHLILIYEAYANEQPEYAPAWNDAIAWIREWIDKSSIVEEEEDGWS